MVNENEKIIRENEKLKKQLLEFKSLEEDLMARRVFEKSRKLLTVYLTVGGLLVLLSGVVGIKSLVDYTKGVVKSKLESLSKEEIDAALKEEGKRQIAAMVKIREEELINITQQQMSRIVSAANPITRPIAESDTVSFAAKVDYSSSLTAVRDQGKEGNSVGFAVAAALEYVVSKSEGRSIVMSPRFIYYYARKKGGLPLDRDSGAFMRDAVNVVVERGGVSEDSWPYRAGEYANNPPDNIATAKHYQIEKALSVGSVKQLKLALNSHGPVPGGIIIFRSSFSDQANKTGKIEIPKADETATGSHAICFVGYDDIQRNFKFRNSWGLSWGDNGYGYLPYEYVDKFLTDTWVFQGPLEISISNKKMQPTQRPRG